MQQPKSSLRRNHWPNHASTNSGVNFFVLQLILKLLSVEKYYRHLINLIKIKSAHFFVVAICVVNVIISCKHSSLLQLLLV